MTELVFVDPQELSVAWPHVGALVASLAQDSGGRFETADFVAGIQSKMMQLWAANDGQQTIGVMLSEIRGYPRSRDAHLFAATGQNADRWIGLMPRVEEWAREERCKSLKATCRPGWEKLLRPIGFSRTHLVLEKSL